MVLNYIQDCCSFAVAALDGMYGWFSETIAILIFVLFFNCLTKWILRHLHQRFERQGKIWKDSFVKALYEPLSYYVWFLASVQALDLIAARIVYELPIENRHTILAIGALAAFVWFLLRWKKFIVQHLISKSKIREVVIEQGKIAAIDKILTVAILFFSALLLMEITDRSVNTIIAFGGVGGLALAFASQEIISNFFGGFMIYLTQPFTIGDWILIPDHNIEGHVEEIGWYMTRVRSLDKRPIYIPNSIFSKLIVITPSRMSHRQIKETLNVWCDDLKTLKATTEEIKTMLKQHLDLDCSQPIIVRLAGFGDYSMDIYVSAFTPTIDTEGFMKVKEDILYQIMTILDKNGVEFATPTQQISLLSPDLKAKPSF